jgi:hypothetical protein
MNGRGRVYTIRRTENRKNEGTDQLIDEGEAGRGGGYSGVLPLCLPPQFPITKRVAQVDCPARHSQTTTAIPCRAANKSLPVWTGRALDHCAQAVQVEQQQTTHGRAAQCSPSAHRQ